jgi:hypothetical protein
LFAALALLFCASLVPAARAAEDLEGAYLQSPLERDLARILSGRVETGSFVLHFRPGSKAAEAAPRSGKELEGLWRRLCEKLDLRPRAKIHAFLYETSADLGRLTGRAAGEAIALGGSVHVPLDRPSRAAALARLIEPLYGRAGGKIVAELDPSHDYAFRLACRGGAAEASLDGAPLAKFPADGTSGSISFGVEGGRLTVSDLKVRETPSAPWQFPLRGGEQAIEADLDGRWTVSGEALEGVRYSRWSRARIAGANVKDFELECKLRASDGASVEVAFHAAGERESDRIYFLPGGIVTTSYRGGKRAPGTTRLVTGPTAALREGFVQALALEAEGRSAHQLARALGDRNLLSPPLSAAIATAIPQDGTERTRRRVMLASFVAFCLEKHGVARYRDLHFADLSAGMTRTPLGEVADLDEQWKSYLRGLDRPADEAQKADRELGLDVFAEKAKWRDLTPAMKERKFRTSGGGKWSVDAEGLQWDGAAGAAAGRAVPSDPAPRKGAIRATLRFSEGSRARIGIAGHDQRTSAVVISASGASLVTPDNTVAAKSESPLEAGQWYEIALVLEGGAGRVYLDGVLAAEAKGLAEGPGQWTIECEGRRVELRSVDVRAIE